MPTPAAKADKLAAESSIVVLTPARAARLAAARHFSIEAARLCSDRRCRDVRVLDVSAISPVCDFFVLATGVSDRQMGAVAREVEELAGKFDLRPLHSVRRGEPNDRWVAIDLVDVIVHIFNDEARQYYDLDNLWGDAAEVMSAK